MAANDAQAKESPPEKGQVNNGPHPDQIDQYFEDTAKTPRKFSQFFSHFKARDLKNLFKSSLAVWVMTILIFINPTLNTIGQATFFGCVVLFIVPPSGVVFIHVLAGLTICIGMALAWAWGTITMKAALATRPAADLQAQYAVLQQAIASGSIQASGQSTALQVAIYNGLLLDTRVTLTYFCMMGLFIYLMARIRVVAPKLTLVGIFSMIIADIYITTAPLLPTFQGTIPKTLILPTAIAVGIGMVCNILIFPQSTSSIVVDSMSDILSPMPDFVRAFAHSLGNTARNFDTKQIERLQLKLAVAYKSADASAKFLPLDFSYIHWSPSDVGSLQKPLRGVLVAFGELVQLPISRERMRTKKAAFEETVKDLMGEDATDFKFPVAHYQIAKVLALRETSRHPDIDRLIMETATILTSCATPLLETWSHGITVVIQALQGAFDKGPVKNLTAHEETLQSLKNLAETFTADTSEKLLLPHAHLFDSDGNLKSEEEHDRRVLLSYMLGLLYQERIINISKALENLLQEIINLEKARERKRVWAPAQLGKLLSWASSKDDATPGMPGNPNSTPPTAAATKPRQRSDASRSLSTSASPTLAGLDGAARLEDMRVPRHRPRSMASKILLDIVNFFGNDAGVHAARTLILSIALAVPAVITTSSGFYYREKGLWALIMAQMAIVPYTSDFISGLILRLTATVAGGVIGLVCWYIGAGSGSGNPYGMAAVMAVAIVVLMYWRLFAPQEQLQAGIMLTSTLYLVVAYSWNDTHNPTYGNPGVGYNVFWRRLLLVLIGFAASAIVMFLPRPPSGHRHYRDLLSSQLSSFKERYALFVSTWEDPPADLVEVVEREGLLSQEVLETSIQPMTLLKFEFSSSNLDSRTLVAVGKLCIDLNTTITQLLVYARRLTSEQRARFMLYTGANDEIFVADLMAVFSLVQGTLSTGKPLPTILRTPLVSRSLGKARRNGPDEVDGGAKEMTAREMLTGDSGRNWASAVGAFISLSARIDELVIILKKAVGEEFMIDSTALAV
ncbi:hypothetical protein PFICI_06360 [Pestalotiopsis fici W106-1]|uniref:ER transporter 6TM N-terminal domain-containing protein n=1 Tax=Pestalotiopsis fici (strain W106-1 / CGMCC3.15140) TaxID=1229662 RepID=W3X5G3_PESFW|nr:uncharacterized protein PFICI_06360 [Pestalotiopsis fici W106-1]ETS81358.1 hypothetical protein PFICI_06360 [Pestalotiopsis fici W106-1]